MAREKIVEALDTVVPDKLYSLEEEAELTELQTVGVPEVVEELDELEEDTPVNVEVYVDGDTVEAEGVQPDGVKAIIGDQFDKGEGDDWYAEAQREVYDDGEHVFTINMGQVYEEETGPTPETFEINGETYEVTPVGDTEVEVYENEVGEATISYEV